MLPDGTITFPLIGEMRAAGKTVEHLRRERFDYDEVVEGKNLAQNITLQRDDTIVVP